MQLSIEEIKQAVNGTYDVAPANDAAQATGIVWDSREVAGGNVYLALKGERVDGHNFAKQAIDAGAACVLATQPLDAAALDAARNAGAAVVRVEDAQQALELLAGAWRTKLSGKVVALTGSTGKTTTKNLVRDVLGAYGATVATAGNQNNELGVPKTVLNASADTASTVVEMGMRGLHQIDALCAYVKPEWGIITNVGESHIELLGSRKNIALAKAELFCALPNDTGVAFMNAASDFAAFVCNHAQLASRNVALVCYDGTPDAQQHMESFSVEFEGSGFAKLWARDIVLDAQGRASFTLCAEGFGAHGLAGSASLETASCSLELRGMHNVSNACAAAAVGYARGLGLAQCAEALAAALPEAGRQDMLVSAAHTIDCAGAGTIAPDVPNAATAVPAGVTVVDDSYNANPDSMRASLATFASLQVQGRRIAVLGDMGELGSFAPECHQRVGAYAAQCNLDLLVCAGTLARDIAQAAQSLGMDAARIICVENAAEALCAVAGVIETGDAVLVKASHFMDFGTIVEGLVG